MSLLSKLFGGGKSPEAAPKGEIYEGFSITATPQRADGGYRIGALIEKDGKRHDLIRADVIADHDTAVEASVAKAKQMIDQMGDRLF
ncbi:HlyU family transcriptional regulator [Primorskyibacter sp. S187A]|uniref:HlyU family transcriptional regulator n=1 Tax=Primorskyibacter sp. S187A TaxID=3415130 RepID=UPI003C79DAF3